MLSDDNKIVLFCVNFEKTKNYTCFNEIWEIWRARYSATTNFTRWILRVSKLLCGTELNKSLEDNSVLASRRLQVLRVFCALTCNTQLTRVCKVTNAIGSRLIKSIVKWENNIKSCALLLRIRQCAHNRISTREMHAYLPLLQRSVNIIIIRCT